MSDQGVSARQRLRNCICAAEVQRPAHWKGPVSSLHLSILCVPDDAWSPAHGGDPVDNQCHASTAIFQIFRVGYAMMYSRDGLAIRSDILESSPGVIC